MNTIKRSEISSKTRLTCALLCWFTGFLGIHRFYVKKTGTGIIMLLTFGGLGIWVIVDFILILTGHFYDKEGKRIFAWQDETATIIEDA